MNLVFLATGTTGSSKLVYSIREHVQMTILSQNTSMWQFTGHIVRH